jgi:hypothetical protein
MKLSVHTLTSHTHASKKHTSQQCIGLQSRLQHALHSCNTYACPPPTSVEHLCTATSHDNVLPGKPKCCALACTADMRRWFRVSVCSLFQQVAYFGTAKSVKFISRP